jgi:hypothetical protein
VALPFVKVADLKSDNLNVSNPDTHNAESLTEPIISFSDPGCFCFILNSFLFS